MCKEKSMVDEMREYSNNVEKNRGYYHSQLVQENQELLKRLTDLMKSKTTTKYVIGFDPYKEDGGSSFASSLFPIKELQEQLNKVKSKKMKTKKFYHTFPFKDRGVTLCLLVTEEQASFSDLLSGAPKVADLSVGYSVSHPEDIFDETLGKKIASNRAEHTSASIKEFNYGVPSELAFDLAILKGFALRFERLIRRGEVTIKGIRDVE